MGSTILIAVVFILCSLDVAQFVGVTVAFRKTAIIESCSYDFEALVFYTPVITLAAFDSALMYQSPLKNATFLYPVATIFITMKWLIFFYPDQFSVGL